MSIEVDTELLDMFRAEVEELISSGVASGGMAPKLRAAARAARAGVGEVRIGGLELLSGESAGTRIVA